MKRVEAVFFRGERGGEPVRDWLKNRLDKNDRYRIGVDIKTVEFGWPVGMPVCRPLGGGMYEIRTNLKDRIARVIFCIHGRHMILLHGFIKKERKTPAPDLALARKRQAMIEEANG